MENLRILFIAIMLLLFSSIKSVSNEKFLLENVPATFEEEKIESQEGESLIINKKKNNKTKSDGKVYVHLRALDKITAKTSSIRVAVGEIVTFGKLKIRPLKCAISSNQNAYDVTAYLQVIDTSNKEDKQVFVFNGWTFASSPTINSIEHSIYDLWLLNCENV